jgi:hypothetical protein
MHSDDGINFSPIDSIILFYNSNKICTQNIELTKTSGYFKLVYTYENGKYGESAIIVLKNQLNLKLYCDNETEIIYVIGNNLDSVELSIFNINEIKFLLPIIQENEKISIDTKTLENGVYLLKASTDIDCQVLKFIK